MLINPFAQEVIIENTVPIDLTPGYRKGCAPFQPSGLRTALEVLPTHVKRKIDLKLQRSKHQAELDMRSDPSRGNLKHLETSVIPGHLWVKARHSPG